LAPITNLEKNNMFCHKLRAPLLLLLFGVLTQSGCHRAPPPTPADAALTTLREALDLWKKGETVDAMFEGYAIAIAEPKWKDGFRLVDFEVLGNGEMNGFDWQCKVRLWLQDKSGTKSEEKAIYNISTAPKLVIVRYQP
jgi:hypothetical protein